MKNSESDKIITVRRENYILIKILYLFINLN